MESRGISNVMSLHVAMPTDFIFFESDRQLLQMAQ